MKEAVKSLEDGLKMLSEIARLTNNAVIITGLDGKIQYVNEGFTRITGYTREEAMGYKPGKLLQGSDTNAETIKRIRKKLANYERVDETIINYSKEGRKYWLKLDIYPYFDEDGTPLRFMAVESDVTELKEKELAVSEQNDRIFENISYAQKLQDALFRTTAEAQVFKEFFVLDQPKDVVGGDFYLFDQIQNKKIVLVGDCTGHGASGAMLTAACVSVIKEALKQYKTLSPKLVIEKSLQRVVELINDQETGILDSFEATLAIVDEVRKEVRFASTTQDVYYVGINESKKIKAGKAFGDKPINDQAIAYEEGAMLYLASDGLKDQFNAEMTKKYGSKRLFELLGKVSDQNMDEQKATISATLTEWSSNEEQTDDMLMIGLRL